jgi:hypothetical protein
LDGKQRLNTIIEFMENKFDIQGYYWTNLSTKDRNHFESFQVFSCELPENTTEEQKIRLFLRVNKYGKVMSKEHLDYVESLLK